MGSFVDVSSVRYRTAKGKADVGNSKKPQGFLGCNVPDNGVSP